MGSANLLRNEKGIGPYKAIIALVLIALIFFLGIKYILIRVHYLSVKDEVTVQAANASMYNDEYMRREILDRAMDAKVALTEEMITIARIPGRSVTVSVSYRDSLRLLVKTFYFDFDIEETASLTR